MNTSFRLNNRRTRAISIVLFFIQIFFFNSNSNYAQTQGEVNSVIKELNGYIKELNKAKTYREKHFQGLNEFLKTCKNIDADISSTSATFLSLRLDETKLYGLFGTYGYWENSGGPIDLLKKSIKFLKKYNRYNQEKLDKIRTSLKAWRKIRPKFDETFQSLVHSTANARRIYLSLVNAIGNMEYNAYQKFKIKNKQQAIENKKNIESTELKLYKYLTFPPFESLVEKVYVFKNIVFDGGPLESHLRLLKDQINTRIRNYVEYEKKTGGELKAKIRELSKKQDKLNTKAKKLSNDLKKKTLEILSTKRAKITPLVKAYIGTRKLSQKELAELENKIIESYEKGRHSENIKRFKRRNEILKYIDKLNTSIKAKTQDDAQLKILEKLNNEYLQIDEALWNIKKEQYKLDSEFDLVFRAFDRYREELDKRVEAIEYAQNDLKQKLASTANAKVKYIFVNAGKYKILQAVATPGLENEKKRMKSLINKLTKMKREAKRIKDKALRNFVSAREDAITAGERLSGWRGLIMKRALTNATMEFAQNIKDVIIDGGKEGIPGMLAALAGKTATFIQDYKSGKLTKDDIDYKAIKKRVRKKLADTSKVISTALDAAKGHVKGELTKMIYEQKGLAEYTTDIVKIGLTLDSSSTKEQLQNYYKFAVDLDEKGFSHLKDIAKEKYAVIKDNAKKLWEKRNSSLKEIKKDLDQLKIGDKHIKDIGKDLAKGAAIEFFKAGISQHLKEEEIKGWAELFEKDFIADGLNRVYLDSQKRLNRILRELQKARKDYFNLTKGMNDINPYLIDYNRAFFEIDKLKIQVLSGDVSKINQRIFIDKVETHKINNENFSLDAKTLGKETPLKVDLKIVFEAQR